MKIFGRQKIRASEFGEGLALLSLTWWKEEGKTIFNSAIEKAKIKATERKGAEEALVLGMFAMTWACENVIKEPLHLPSILDSFHRKLYLLLLEEGHITSRKVGQNVTFDASMVASEFEANLLRVRYEAYRKALSDTNPVMALGRVAKNAITDAQEVDPLADLRFANVVTAVLEAMKHVIVDLQKDNKVVT